MDGGITFAGVFADLPTQRKHMVKIKDVYVITEHTNDDSSKWTKIGVAFVNRDDSLNVVLEALPLTGKIHIRDRVPAEKKENKKVA